MKNLFHLTDTQEILFRIDQLKPDAQPRWGRMHVAQMLAHCSEFQEVATGELHTQRSWLGLVVGRFAKPVFYNDKPLPRNMSTIPDILISDLRDFETEKQKLKQRIETFQANGEEKCTTHPHPFFGKFTPEQWGKGLYKHLDHHLKQFGG